MHAEGELLSRDSPRRPLALRSQAADRTSHRIGHESRTWPDSDNRRSETIAGRCRASPCLAINLATLLTPLRSQWAHTSVSVGAIRSESITSPWRGIPSYSRFRRGRVLEHWRSWSGSQEPLMKTTRSAALRGERGMTITRLGGCTCGAVRYALKGEPYKFGICDCTKRRKE